MPWAVMLGAQEQALASQFLTPLGPNVRESNRQPRLLYRLGRRDQINYRALAFPVARHDASRDGEKHRRPRRKIKRYLIVQGASRATGNNRLRPTILQGRIRYVLVAGSRPAQFPTSPQPTARDDRRQIVKMCDVIKISWLRNHRCQSQRLFQLTARD